MHVPNTLMIVQYTGMHHLGYFEGTLFHQPVVDFPFEHQNIFKENILYQERYGGVT